MATLEAVTVELQNLNGLSDLQLETTLEQNDRLNTLSVGIDKTNEILSEVLDVMRQFMNVVPEQIVQGFQPIIQSVENNNTTTVNEISRGFEALVDLEERHRLLDQREESEGEGGKGKSKTGFFASNFQKGMDRKPFEKVTSGITDFIADAIQTAGAIVSVGGLLPVAIAGIGKVFGVMGKAIMGVGKLVLSSLKFLGTGLLKGISLIGKGLKLLRVGMVALMTGVRTAVMSAVSAIMPAIAALAPFIAIGALIAAGVTALVMGINSFIEDFNAQEGSVFDKILAGLLGFVDGFMKILTIPLDWIINLTAKVLEFFGFDGAAKVLEEFSLTDMVDSMTDGILEFLLKIKDGIVGFASDAWNGIKSFFGFGDDEETNAPERLSDRERKTLETIRDAREDGIQRAVAQGYTQEEAEKMAESGKFDPAKTRRNSRKISTQEINERLQQDMLVDISQGVVEEKKYRYDITDPVTGELIDSAGTPEEAAQIAMQTGGKIENPVERTGTTPAITTGEVASTTPAINSITSDATVVGQSVLNDLSSDSSSVVSASNDRSVMNETMIQETTKLNDNRSEVGGAGGIVAPTVNANNNSTNVTSNTTNVHGIPSAVDKSDRTDRRGSFRGRG